MTKTTTKKAKKQKEPEPYWKSIVSTFFRFYSEKLLDVPSFDGSQPRDLRMIVEAMRKRVAHAGLEWNEERAVKMLKVFLAWAWEDDWLRENFLPFNLNRQKDKIFFRIKQYQLQKQNQ